jgi:hypothetical protein
MPLCTNHSPSALAINSAGGGSETSERIDLSNVRLFENLHALNSAQSNPFDMRSMAWGI